MKTIELIRTGGLCLGSLLKEGWIVEETTDFQRVMDISAQLGKAYFTPMMDPQHNDFTRNNVVWHVAIKDGDPIAMIGARLDNIGSEGLGAYLGRSMVRGYPPVGSEALKFSAPHVAQKLTGKMAYVGELFVRSDARGKRANLRHFLMLLHTVIALRWSPDWHYAFMRDRDIGVGMDSIYWFTHRWPGVITWPDPPPGRSGQEWLVALARTDVETIARYYLNLVKGVA